MPSECFCSSKARALPVSVTGLGQPCSGRPLRRGGGESCARRFPDEAEGKRGCLSLSLEGSFTHPPALSLRELHVLIYACRYCLCCAQSVAITQTREKKKRRAINAAYALSMVSEAFRSRPLVSNVLNATFRICILFSLLG